MPIRRRKRDVKFGLPLTTADLSKARAELAECMDPGEFRRRVDGLDKRVQSEERFNDNKYKFLREAWVLAELSKHMPFVKIRLAEVGKDPPDGYARTADGEEVKIEVTSAQNPGRPLGADYRPDERIKGGSIEAPIEKVEEFAAILEDAIRKKVNDENRGCALVVEQNIVDAIMTPDEKEKAILSVKGKYAADFKHLWILWNGKIF